jgi:hypothetical protein
VLPEDSAKVTLAPNPRAYAAKILGTVIISNAIGYTFCRIRRERPTAIE